MIDQNPKLSRREIIKLLSLTPLLALPGSTSSSLSISENRDLPNIVILVFDTWAANHLPCYGYHRDTMPELSKFLERASVYHSHYSTSNFTSPGTASILTSRYPWNHRAFNLYGEIIKNEVPNNLFAALEGTAYTRMGFSQNPLAIYLLAQFAKDLELFPMADETALIDYYLSDNFFRNDIRTASIVETAALRPPADKPLSFFLSLIDKYIANQNNRDFNSKYKDQYPLGPVAHFGRSYLMPDMMDWVANSVSILPQPTVSYIHLFPPHEPYRPSADFIGRFADGWSPAEKPGHFLSEGYTQETLNVRRQVYDEYLAYIDSELGKVLTAWGEQGVLDNTILMLTSDHGEMFERGILRHDSPTLFQPLIRVPLIISSPGQTARQDIYTSSSNLDLLPTIMKILDQPIPEWCEGEVLPPYAEPDKDRTIFAIENRTTPLLAPIEKATIAAMRDSYKLIYYMGYDLEEEMMELFDLDQDPEELNNLASTFPEIVSSLKSEILTQIEKSNQRYQK